MSHPVVERLPLYKAVDSGKREHGVAVVLDYVPASRADIIAAVLALPEVETFETRAHYTIDGKWDWECVPAYGCPSDRYAIIAVPEPERAG